MPSPGGYPPFGVIMRAAVSAMLGDQTTQPTPEQLRRRSPLTYAGQITAPVLVIHGSNDQRVPKAESDQIIAARANDAAARYLVFDDEGHGFTSRATTSRPAGPSSSSSPSSSDDTDGPGMQVEPLARADGREMMQASVRRGSPCIWRTATRLVRCASRVRLLWCRGHISCISPYFLRKYVRSRHCNRLHSQYSAASHLSTCVDLACSQASREYHRVDLKIIFLMGGGLDRAMVITS